MPGDLENRSMQAGNKKGMLSPSPHYKMGRQNEPRKYQGYQLSTCTSHSKSSNRGGRVECSGLKVNRKITLKK